IVHNYRPVLIYSTNSQLPPGALPIINLLARPEHEALAPRLFNKLDKRLTHTFNTMNAPLVEQEMCDPLHPLHLLQKRSDYTEVRHLGEVLGQKAHFQDIVEPVALIRPCDGIIGM